MFCMEVLEDNNAPNISLIMLYNAYYCKYRKTQYRQPKLLIWCEPFARGKYHPLQNC